MYYKTTNVEFGKGQSTIRNKEDIQKQEYAIEGSRGDLNEVIVEEFINFDYEITLLTPLEKYYIICPPLVIGKKRDYQRVGSLCQWMKNI